MINHSLNGLSVTEGPSSLPVSLSEAKSHFRVTTSVEDNLIEDVYIPAAVSYAETVLNGPIVNRTYLAKYSNCPSSGLLLPRYSRTIEQFSFINTSLNEVIISSDYYDFLPYRSHLVYRDGINSQFVNVRDAPNSLLVSFIGGMGEADSIPLDIKAAILEIVTEIYINRQSLVLSHMASGGLNKLNLAHTILYSHRYSA